MTAVPMVTQTGATSRGSTVCGGVTVGSVNISAIITQTSGLEPFEVYMSLGFRLSPSALSGWRYGKKDVAHFFLRVKVSQGLRTDRRATSRKSRETMARVGS